MEVLLFQRIMQGGLQCQMLDGLLSQGFSIKSVAIRTVLFSSMFGRIGVSE